MSGIAGSVHFDGKPVDRDLLEDMAGAIAFRGPDAQHVWVSGSVAFVHTLLKTTFEAENEQQPASLDGQVWITADARIDAREELIETLGLPKSALTRPDCELILHSYAKWGEACVDHLLGDFAFAIWDLRKRKLFCARDHFGVKPFYYAKVGGGIVFSNTLNCIRVHREVSNKLNDLAIADFLIFDYNQDPLTTTFSDIQRIPGAHVLIATGAGVTIRRYWSLPEGESIRHNRTHEYVEHFSVLLQSATSDRLRTNKVAITMSGGLDSSSVAAFARKVSPQTELTAHTIVYDWLIPDDERYYAGLVANHLDIPIQYYRGDDVRPFEGTENAATPEPLHDPLFESLTGFRRQIACETRVVLTGDGADSLFCLSPFLCWSSVRNVPMFPALVIFGRYSHEMRSLPKFRLRSTILGLLGRTSPRVAELPGWLDSNLIRQRDLEARIIEISKSRLRKELRPYARSSLRSGYWPWQFEIENAAWSNIAVEPRHAYLDIRLVRYLLALPELPYAMDKYLLRLALKSKLPESVRTRRKTPLRADPVHAAITQNRVAIPQALSTAEKFSKFIDVTAVPTVTSELSPNRLWIDSKPLTLNNWIKEQEQQCAISKISIRPRVGSPIIRQIYGSMATSLC